MRIGALIGGVALGCEPSVTVGDAAKLMTEHNQGSLLVMKGDDLVGIITERDVMAAAAEGSHPDLLTVADCMTPDPDTASPDLDVHDAAAWMLATGYRHMPVLLDEGRIGMLSMKDILWAITEQEIPQ